MARLNEPMVSTDSVETLRRKFLRQNRDIARVNSTQSLKIRTLENECVRLLSENLDLRGQILRLQTELEDSRAQQIANHALEIKEKMEAQLAEWGTMLASLGHEPTPRSRSPRGPKRVKRRSSIGRVSMSEWRRRDTVSSMKDLEAAALQEGRLAPIWENKTCPRETLNREEILALRAVVDDNDDSPDLGPPPVSRFVDEDPVKIDLPPRHSPSKSDYASLEKASSDPQPKQQSTPSPKKDERANEPVSNIPEVDNEPTEPRAVDTKESQPTTQVAKANLKRKLREEDEKENPVISKPPTRAIEVAKDRPEKAANVKPQSTSRPIKLPSNRREVRDKSSSSVTQRRPLGAKSTNEHIKSPKKTAKPPTLEEVTKEDIKGRKIIPVEIPVPEPQPIFIAHVEIETETLSSEPNLAVPDTPEATPREEVRDTPPPTDISSRGETSRGSRRARTAVSYAEPNLRDKMRRPTKQLLDAVSGEGKHIRRTSQSKKEEFPSSNPSSVVKSEEKLGSWKDLPADRNMSRTNLDVMASPLARKGSKASSDDLTMSVAMDKKKRADAESSSYSSGESNTTKSGSRAASRRVDEIAAREAEVAKIFEDEADVYDFPSSSPKDGSKRTTTTEETSKRRNTKGSRQSRSRRLSSVAREDLEIDAESQNHEKAPRHAGSRRATMAASKETKMDIENVGHDSSVEGDSLNSSSSGDVDASVRDRASMRRRSMML
ncbi:Shugoshin [Daldinia childiae]|uniref:Shugoshin n=1 Tax=Daldinia childiae TaxID=326645 RepID=UPI001447CC3B|nr:Shugoshin [Daldinia childiae]KAF3070454.1 Shugoshin [Daldinia childiae]